MVGVGWVRAGLTVVVITSALAVVGTQPAAAEVMISTSIVGTSAPHTSGQDAVIGERVTYQVTVTVPEAASPAFTITDVLDCGLAVVGVDGVVASPGVVTDVPGGFGAVAAAAVVSGPSCPGGEGAGRQVVFDFGTLTNGDTDTGVAETITITFTAAVLNAASNVDGVTRGNDVTASAGGVGSAPDLTVRSPRPMLTKGFSVESGDAGDVVTVTLGIANTTGIDVFDAVLQDLVPAELSILPGTTACSGSPPTTTDAVGPTIGATWATLAAGASSTCTFDVLVGDDFPEVVAVTNTATLTWTSLPGPLSVSGSPHTTLHVERTGSAGNPGQLNDNVATASDTLRIGPIVSVKRVAATSAPQTTANQVTIGEVVSYSIDVSLPEGDYSENVVVTDRLPPGLAYLAGTAVVDASALQGTLDPAPTIASSGGSGDDLVLTFASPTRVDPDNDPGNNAFTVGLDAIVVDAAESTAGATLSNSVRVVAGGSANTSSPVEVVVVEPAVSVDKDVVGQNADDDAVDADVDAILDYTVTVTNGTTSASPAYDMVVTDVVPDGLVVDVASVTAGGGAYDAAGRTITWTVPGPLAAGAALTLGYSAEVGDSSTLSAADTFANTATIGEYFGFPAAVRAAPANADVGYRAYGGGSDVVTVVPHFPQLAVDKSSVGAAVVGEPFTWNLTISNTSAAATAHDVDVADTLGQDWAFVAGSVTVDGAAALDPVASGTPATGLTLEWIDLLDLAPGQSVTITYAAVPTWDTRDNAGHLNTVVVSADDADGAPANGDGPYTATADDQPGLTGAAVGDFVWADLDGNGRQDAGEPGLVGVEVDLRWAGVDGALDTADDETLSTVTDAAGAYSFALLPAGDVRVDVTAPLGLVPTIPDSPLATDATDSDLATPLELTLTAGAIDATIDAGFVRSVDLVIDKSHAATFQAGDIGVFTIDVTNLGPSASEGVVTVRDLVPDSLSPSMVSSATDALGRSWACDFVDQEVVCTIDGTWAVGEAFPRIVLEVRVRSAAYPSVTNRAEVLGPPGTQETVTSNNRDDDTVPVAPLVELGIDKSHTGTFIVGETGTYILTVTNAGPNPDPGPIVITDDLPVELTYVEGSGLGWNCTSAGQAVTCTHAATPLAAGASTTVVLTVEVGPLAEGDVLNSAHVETRSVESDEDTKLNNTDDDDAQVVAGADLAITKRHEGQARVGLPFAWTVSVENRGPSTSPGPITVRDEVPEGFGSVAATGDGWTCTVDVRTVTCVGAGPLAVAATAPPITVSATPLAGFEGTRTNTATVEGTIFDTDLTNNAASDRVDVVAAIDLVTTKTLVSTAVSPSTALWRIEVANRGPSSATGVTLTDVLPSGLLFRSATGPGWTCAAAGQQVTCVLDGPLAAGASSAVEILTGVVGAEGTSLTNTASVRGDGVELDSSNNTDDADTRVLAEVAVNTGAPGSAPVASSVDLASDTASDTASVAAGDLAATGTDADRHVDLGLLMLGAGSLLVIGTRRRRHRTRRRR